MSTQQEFIDACKNGNLEQVQLILQQNISDICTLDEIEDCFALSCIFGNLEVAKLLFDLLLELEERIDIFENNNHLFLNVCNNGELEVAKWLYEKKPTIYIGIFDFLDVCRNGYLHVADWFLEICKNVNELFFLKILEEACIYNNLEVVKWVFQKCVNIDFSYKNNLFINIARRKRNQELAQLLCAINPKYKIIINNQDIRCYHKSDAEASSSMILYCFLKYDEINTKKNKYSEYYKKLSLDIIENISEYL